MFRGLVLAAVVGTAACADDAQVTFPTQDSRPSSALGPLTREEAAFSDVLRSVAIALQDQGLRQRVKNDMRVSPFAEHKLDLTPYLRGNSGGILLAKMAQVSGRGREDLLASLDALPALEMYFPVDAHREGWEGGADLLVSGDLRSEARRMISFDLQGNPVELSPTELSPTPTLVIIRRETDFTDPLPGMRYVNVNDRGGRTIGSWVPAAAASRSLGPAFSTSLAERYRSQQGYGKRERMFEYQQQFHLESNWLNQGDPELFMAIMGSTPNAAAPGKALLSNRIRFGIGKDDNRNWHTDNTDLYDWAEAFGDYVHFRIWEADGDKLVPKTATFGYTDANGGTQTASYTYERHESNDDLGEWTYSYHSAALVTGYDGHGVGRWGFDNGFIRVITDYVSP
jgi:hypothetical protein